MGKDAGNDRDMKDEYFLGGAGQVKVLGQYAGSAGSLALCPPPCELLGIRGTLGVPSLPSSATGG